MRALLLVAAALIGCAAPMTSDEGIDEVQEGVDGEISEDTEARGDHVGAACGLADTTPPKFDALRLSTHDVDVTRGPADIQVTLEITDASEIAPPQVVIANEAGVIFDVDVATKNASQPNTWTVTMQMPAVFYPEIGSPISVYAMAKDVWGNTQTTLTELQVVSARAEDNDKPGLSLRSTPPASVDVTSEDAVVTYTIRVVDNEEFVALPSLRFGVGVSGGLATSLSGVMLSENVTFEGSFDRNGRNAAQIRVAWTIPRGAAAQFAHPTVLVRDASNNKTELALPVVEIKNRSTAPSYWTGSITSFSMTRMGRKFVGTLRTRGTVANMEIFPTFGSSATVQSPVTFTQIRPFQYRVEMDIPYGSVPGVWTFNAFGRDGRGEPVKKTASARLNICL